MQAWKADPKGTPVGGARLRAARTTSRCSCSAQAAGVDPKQVNYVSYDGGGELLTALLGVPDHVGVTGLGEILDQIAAGQVRVLAVTGAERAPDVDAPTLKEAGVDMVFTNWRGMVAPPGAHRSRQADADQARRRACTTRRSGGQAMERNGWTDAYLPATSSRPSSQTENERVAALLGSWGSA